MFRDFSKSAKEQLLQYVKDVTPVGGWNKFTDSIGDIGLTIQSVFGELNISRYVDNVSDYHKKIMDKQDTTSEQIDKIFADVEGVDTKYMGYTTELHTYGSKIKTLISDMADMIDPNGGNLSVDKMDKVLAADIEALANAQTTAEKALEEEMLGMEALGAEMSPDPVNLSTGNFTYEHKDLEIGGEIPLIFHRYYNSKDTRIGTLGKCFLHNYEISVEENAEGNISLRLADGQIYHFSKEPEGTYMAENLAEGNFEKTEEGYKLTKIEKVVLLFDLEGRLVRQEDLNGRGISFYYNEKKQLIEAKADNGSVLKYIYDEQGLYLSCVEDHIGRIIKLNYSGALLETVELANGAIYTYRYGVGGRITEVINPCNISSVKSEYDKANRVVRQDFPDGSTMEFEYDDVNRRVTMTERNGSKTVYVHDDRYRNVETIYDDGTKEKFIYNAKNQCISKSDRNGYTSRMAYDNRGNLVQVIDPLKRRINMTYDADNHLLNVSINGIERLKNHYDSKGNLLLSEGADGSGNYYRYDSMGRIIAVEDSENGVMELFYDERGNVIQIKEQGENVTNYVYDKCNRVIKSVDANGNETQYSYNDADLLTKVTNALGGSISYEYNSIGKLVKVVDYDGYEINLTYNSIDKYESFTDKEGNVTSYLYDKMWNISELRRPNGAITSYQYNAASRLETMVLPEGGKISYTYDGNGNMLTEQDAAGNTKQYSYDALNRRVSMTDEEGYVTKYTYDTEGNLTQIIDPLGNVTAYEYDSKRNLIGETDALGNTTKYTYTKMGYLKDTIYPNGTEINRTYENGRLAKVVRSDGNFIQYEYDACGNVIAITNATIGRVAYQYDALNRIVSMVLPNGGVRKYEYNPIGQVTLYVDENGNETQYDYSPNGLLKKVVDALGNESEYTYDCVGNLVEMVRRGNATSECQTTKYEWNLEEQLIKVVDPLGDVEEYIYNALGKVEEKIDKDGYHTKLSYNKLGDITDIIYNDGRSVSFSYDALRRIEEMKDWNGVTKVVSDALGRAVSVTDADGLVTSYKWGSMGEKEQLVYPDGQRASYSYNEKGQLTEVFAGQDRTTYRYDEIGRLIEKQFSNGIMTSYNYGALGKIQEISHIGKELKEVYKYEYDAAGNKVSTSKERMNMPEDCGCFEYKYNKLNQLISVIKDGKALREYEYDGFGNRIAKVEHTSEVLKTIYSYNAKNQLTEEIVGENRKNYEYDRRGNLVRVLANEQIEKQYVFGPQNVMDSADEVQNGESRQIQFYYNGFGNKVGQSILHRNVKQQDMRYVVDMTRQYFNLLAQKDMVSGEGSVYYWDGNVLGMQSNDNMYYYVQDDLGSPMHLLDENGRSKEGYGFDEFGISMHQHSGLQPFGFTCYQIEEVGDLYFAQARRYNPSAGRFVSEDRVRGFKEAPYTLNYYVYCWNHPTDYVDENGKFVLTAALTVIAVGAGVGAVINGGTQLVKMATGQQDEFKWGELLGSTVEGAIVSGASLIPGGGPVASIAIAAGSGAVSSAAKSVISQGIDDGEIKGGKVLEDAIVGGIVGGVFKGGEELVKGLKNAGSSAAKSATKAVKEKASDFAKKFMSESDALLKNSNKIKDILANNLKPSSLTRKTQAQLEASVDELIKKYGVTLLKEKLKSKVTPKDIIKSHAKKIVSGALAWAIPLYNSGDEDAWYTYAGDYLAKKIESAGETYHCVFS